MRYSNENRPLSTQDRRVGVGVGESDKLYNKNSKTEFPDSDNFLIDWENAKFKIFIPKKSKKGL